MEGIDVELSWLRDQLNSEGLVFDAANLESDGLDTDDFGLFTEDADALTAPFDFGGDGKVEESTEKNLGNDQQDINS